MRVYVAGPMTSGKAMENLRTALDAATELLKHGHVPFVPHLSYFWELVHPQPREAWLTMDFAWIETCGALIRLPGHSHGADREVAFAVRRGIPAFTSVAEFLSSDGHIPGHTANVG